MLGPCWLSKISFPTFSTFFITEYVLLFACLFVWFGFGFGFSFWGEGGFLVCFLFVCLFWGGLL